LRHGFFLKRTCVVTTFFADKLPMTSNQTDLPVDDAPIPADFHTFRFCLKQIAITPVGMPFRLAHADLPHRRPNASIFSDIVPKPKG